MTKLWFKAKRYGWGWQPSSWEGWLVLGIYVTSLIIWNAVLIEYDGLDIAAAGIFSFPAIFIATGALLAICYWKGEKPRWRWGGKD
jgi:hypothetical protein